MKVKQIKEKTLSPDSFPFRLKCIRLRTQFHKLHFAHLKIPRGSAQITQKPTSLFPAKLPTPNSQLSLSKMADSVKTPDEETKNPVQKWRASATYST
jgi:hypothetical protein